MNSDRYQSVGGVKDERRIELDISGFVKGYRNEKRRIRLSSFKLLK